MVPVHLYGQCADMKAIRKIADKHKLLVIEDNAQGIGARGDGFNIGELSDAVCTSFIIQKNLGTFGDGGAVVTNHSDRGPRSSASCAITARISARATASASTAAWTIFTPAFSAPS